MYRDFWIVTGSIVIGRTAQDGVQHIQTALGSPGAYASGNPPAMEGGSNSPPALIGTGPLIGLHQWGTCQTVDLASQYAYEMPIS